MFVILHQNSALQLQLHLLPHKKSRISSLFTHHILTLSSILRSSPIFQQDIEGALDQNAFP